MGISRVFRASDWMLLMGRDLFREYFGELSPDALGLAGRDLCGSLDVRR